MAYLWLLLTVLLETYGDYTLKLWTEEKGSLVIGWGAYALSGLTFAMSLKEKPLTEALLVFILLNLVAVGLLAYFGLDERLTTRQWVGVGFAVAAIVLVEA